MVTGLSIFSGGYFCARLFLDAVERQFGDRLDDRSWRGFRGKYVFYRKGQVDWEWRDLKLGKFRGNFQLSLQEAERFLFIFLRLESEIHQQRQRVALDGLD